MEKGSTKYEAALNMTVNHLRTDKEKIVENKTATYLSLLSTAGQHSFCNSDRSLCCKLQSDYASLAGLNNRSAALLKECKVDDARIMMENAVNGLTAINDNASACAASLSEIATAESTATSRGCDSGAVSTQIDALKSQVRNGNYALDLSALNSAMSSQCGGTSVQAVQPGDVGNGIPAGTGGTQGTAGTGKSKPFCPGMFILFLLPLALMVYSKWDF